MSERSDRTTWFVALRPAFSLGPAHEASNDVGETQALRFAHTRPVWMGLKAGNECLSGLALRR